MSDTAQPELPARLPLEDRLARPMFTLAVLFLAVLGGVLHRHKLPDPEDVELAAVEPDRVELIIQVGILLVILPLFWIEGIWRCVVAPVGCKWRSFRELLLVGLIPPLRLGLRSQGPGRELWLPRLGWRTVNRDLQRDLERIFGLPMIFVALLVLPLLAAEFFFARQVHDHFWLRFLTQAGNALVWFAFAIEFIVMLAVAKKKFHFCILRWMDLAIILLPFLSFLPLIRILSLGRILRLEQLSRLGRIYRMQGVAMRAWRAFLLLQLIQRILGTTPEKQLDSLRELEEVKAEELAELREEIAQLEAEIARKNADNPNPV